MASERNYLAGKLATVTNPSYFLNSSDNPGTPLVAAMLNGDNYRMWA